MLELLSDSLMIAMGQKPFRKAPEHRDQVEHGPKDGRHRWMPSVRPVQD